MSDNMVQVPRVPTQAMLDAAHDFQKRIDISEERFVHQDMVWEIYLAMLAAAPATPPQQRGDVDAERVEAAAKAAYSTMAADAYGGKHYYRWIDCNNKLKERWRRIATSAIGTADAVRGVDAAREAWWTLSEDPEAGAADTVHGLLTEAVVDMLTPVEVSQIAFVRKAFAVLYPIYDLAGDLDDTEVRLFDTKEQAEQFCAVMRSAPPASREGV